MFNALLPGVSATRLGSNLCRVKRADLFDDSTKEEFEDLSDDLYRIDIQTDALADTINKTLSS